MSSSTRGTWIEIKNTELISLKLKSSSTRGTWIEILPFSVIKSAITMSSSTRGTWIEILTRLLTAIENVVVLHTGDVD